MKYLIMVTFLFAISLAWGRSEKTLLDQHYGPDERQIFDLWLPKSNKRTPLVIYIHGGGFVMGSKDEIRKNRIVKKYLEASIAFAAINYRFLKTTPLQTIMREDIAGFVQFMRYHSRKFNINKNYILSHGFSGGGSSSLWLGTHDDIADENHDNPIKRESSRVLAIGHLSAQVSYDFIDWFNYFGREQTERFVGQQIWSRYHFSHFDELFTEKGKAIRQDVDNYENMTNYKELYKLLFGKFVLLDEMRLRNASQTTHQYVIFIDNEQQALVAMEVLPKAGLQKAEYVVK
jgi:hypothetical protein